MKKVLLTGANGFIGKKLSKFLVEMGCSVFGIVSDLKKITADDLCSKVQYLQADLLQPSNLNGILPIDIDVLFHLAWIGVDSDVKTDLDVQLLNVKISLNVINLMNTYNIKKLICIGSASEYAYLSAPIKGEDFPRPSDYYSIMKSSTRMLFQYHSVKDEFEFNYILVPSVYGPGRIDNNIITYTISTLLNGESPRFTKLEQMWNFIHIDDLVYGIYLVGQRGTNQSIYPLGAKKEMSLRRYVEIIRDIINPKIEMGIGLIPYKSKIIDNCIMDCSHTYFDLGFEPKVTFEEGIIETIDFIISKLKFQEI